MQYNHTVALLAGMAKLEVAIRDYSSFLTDEEAVKRAGRLMVAAGIGEEDQSPGKSVLAILAAQKEKP